MYDTVGLYQWERDVTILLIVQVRDESWDRAGQSVSAAPSSFEASH